MSDKIIRAVAKNGMVRIIAGITTELVEDARVIHECTPVAAASLGRMLTAGALLGATLKSVSYTHLDVYKRQAEGLVHVSPKLANYYFAINVGKQDTLNEDEMCIRDSY